MAGNLDAPRIREIATALAAAGYADEFTWSETIRPPATATGFAREAIFVICNSGMKHTVARGIFERVIVALRAGQSTFTAFRHPGKSAAIDRIWADRDALLTAFHRADDKVAFCRSLPWIGGITCYHLAKNLGVDCAKPDVHLQRIADREGETVHALCARLAAETGFRVATVDVVLWRASAIGLLDSRTGAFRPALHMEPADADRR